MPFWCSNLAITKHPILFLGPKFICIIMNRRVLVGWRAVNAGNPYCNQDLECAALIGRSKYTTDATMGPFCLSRSCLKSMYILLNPIKMIFCKIPNYKLGQGESLHGFCSEADPWQLSPPFKGFGSSHSRKRVWVPPPHLVLQSLKDNQCPQFPLTEKQRNSLLVSTAVR